MGNQAGDTDSMVSSLAWAWQLSHSPKPVKAVALLQTAYDAIDLRPENGMALEHARMAPLHGDMLCSWALPLEHAV
jgi:exopolyphosphatase